MTNAQEALRRLREGNRRFAAGLAPSDARLSPAQRSELERGQRPFAIDRPFGTGPMPPVGVDNPVLRNLPQPQVRLRI